MLERPIIAVRIKRPRSRTVTLPGFPSRNFSDSEAKAEQKVKRKQTSQEGRVDVHCVLRPAEYN